LGRGDEHLGRGDEHLGRGGQGGRGDEQDLDQVQCGSNKIWAKVVSSFLKGRNLISSGKIGISY